MPMDVTFAFSGKVVFIVDVDKPVNLKSKIFILSTL
jgi:hypothetical protein